MFLKKSIFLLVHSPILYFLKKYNNFIIKKFGLFNGVKYLRLINHNNANELIKLGFETQIQVVRKAVSDRTEEAEILYNNDCFTATSMLEERVSKGVRHTIQCQRIDDLVREFDLNRVDFIKMDVEGMEVQSLRGAAETIRKWKPRLAISAYHFHDDIYEIAKLIHSMCPDYQIEVLRGMGPICYAW